MRVAYDEPRSQELLVLRPDMIAEFPDGVPRWLRDHPPGRVREMMDLRRRGFTLLGMDPSDDV